MRAVPQMLQQAVMELQPGDSIFANRRADAWAKVEINKVGHPSVKMPFPPLLFESVFRKLPDNWSGNITFFYDFEQKIWTYSLRYHLHISDSTWYRLS